MFDRFCKNVTGHMEWLGGIVEKCLTGGWWTPAGNS